MTFLRASQSCFSFFFAVVSVISVGILVVVLVVFFFEGVIISLASSFSYRYTDYAGMMDIYDSIVCDADMKSEEKIDEERSWRSVDVQGRINDRTIV